MTHQNNGILNTFWARALIRALVNGGIDHFCLSPGYRHTPLVLALADEPTREVFVHFDERGMAFHALGLAKATAKPVAMIVTSGTAAAHLLPAIMEASSTQVPLIALTADRPPELRGTGANQTTDQVRLYQNFVRYQVDLPCPTDSIPMQMVEKEVTTALGFATGAHPGPVHLNCMFRKPFFADLSPPPIPTFSRPTALTHGCPTLLERDVESLASALSQVKTGVILAGQLPPGVSPLALLKLAEKLQWPLLPDILSPLRSAIDHPLVIANYELIFKTLNNHSFPPLAAVIQIGERYVSQRLLDYLAASAPPLYVHIAAHSARYDPAHLISHRITAEVASCCAALCDQLPQLPTSPWLERWQAVSKAAFALTKTYFETQSSCSQPALFHHLGSHIGQKMPLFIANSTPIRHANTFYHPQPQSMPIFGNRGLSGIDGNIATVMGLARGLKTPLIALLGDLAFLHDLNSLAQAKDVPFPIQWIVINNNGGAIFAQLPIKKKTALFTRYFLTPHHLQLQDTARFFGLNYHLIDHLDKLYFLLAARPSTHTLIEVLIDVETDLRTIQELDNSFTCV
ncbi:MAG: 2-succinyl-5-enolpyruvyl-6-hydroxy-3-cyclohexene-1-carboxylic-acid synthase [Chlamydiota bacterium]